MVKLRFVFLKFGYVNHILYLCTRKYNPKRGVPPDKRMKDRIFQLMKRTGKNQKEFADELCVAPATLSGIFKGTTKPSTNIVASIHERFPEISVPWLMFGEGDMYVSAVDTVPADSSVPAGSSAPADMQGAPVVQQDLFAVPSTQAPVQAAIRERVKYIDKPQRKITEIRIFFDDGTYQTFT